MKRRRSSGHRTKEVGLDDKHWRFIESHFGGLQAVFPDLESPASSSESQMEEALYDTSRRHEMYAKQQKLEQTYRDEFNKLRERIQRELETRPEVVEVSHLFDAEELEVVESSPFLPLVVTVQLPKRFQLLEKELVGVETAERFFIVFDGSLVLFSAVSTAGNMMRGFLDAREKLFDIVFKTGKFEVIPPNVTRAGFLLVNGKGKREASNLPFEALLRIGLDVSVKTALKIAYSELWYTMSEFYDTASTVRDIEKLSFRIAREEQELFSSMGELASSKWYHVRKRRRVSKLIRIRAASLLKSMAEYRGISGRISKDVLDFEQSLKDDELLNVFMEEESWKSDLEVPDLDTGSLLAAIEHARSETQTAQLVSITIWAAIVGAIAGGVMTLLLSRFP